MQTTRSRSTSEEHEGEVTWSAPIELTEARSPKNWKSRWKCRARSASRPCLTLDKKLVAKFAGYEKAPANLGEYRPDPMQAELVLGGQVEPAAVAPGGKVKLSITATPNPGWHVYAYEPTDPDIIGGNKPTLIVLSSLPAGWTQSPVVASAEPKVEPAKGEIARAHYHESRSRGLSS